ncbi:MAG: metal ABC transporter permease [Bacteroidales bacterium]|nr:metal ABC transporter permease [Bacteroidales bacterium]
MLDIFEYMFFQNALIGSLLVSICCGILGTYIVTRRLVFISGGITHASFGGLGLGFYAGWNPILTALFFAIGSAFGVQYLSKNGKVREDSAIGVFWALGMAIGIIFIFMSPGFTPSLTEYLFGNILTINRTDLWIFLAFTCVLVIFFCIYNRAIIFTAFDPEFAKVLKIPVKLIDGIMLCFIAVSIVLTIRLIGIVLLMSVITLPQMIAGIFYNDFRKIALGAVFASAFCCVSGLIISYILNVPAGACIVFVLVIVYSLISLSKKLICNN